jgi:hypothetical protein
MCIRITQINTFLCGHREAEEPYIKAWRHCDGCGIVKEHAREENLPRIHPCPRCIVGRLWLPWGDGWISAAELRRLQARKEWAEREGF